MMETAQSLINDALQELLVQANEQPIQTVDFAAGVRYLNRMMASWDAQGLSLGYTKVANPADPITIPDGAVEGVIFNLALRLATSYDIPVMPTLAMSAKEGMAAVENIAVTVQPYSHPCTLPIGSGNEWNELYSDNHFYPCEDDEVLTEQSGSILLEGDTNG